MGGTRRYYAKGNKSVRERQLYDLTHVEFKKQNRIIGGKKKQKNSEKERSVFHRGVVCGGGSLGIRERSGAILEVGVETSSCHVGKWKAYADCVRVL